MRSIPVVDESGRVLAIVNLRACVSLIEASVHGSDVSKVRNEIGNVARSF
jgi:hypothetical protein